MRPLAAILRQPMVHFLLGGALIFALYGLVGGAPEEPNGAPRPAAARDMRIQVSRGQVDSLAQAFASRWRRAPTDDELAALIAEHVREEMLVREALALGLDRDDVVIRRHLRNRMEFLAQDLAALRAPTDEDLRALLVTEADRFRQPAVMSFRHIFLDPARRDASAINAEASQLLARLRGPEGPALADEAGDRFLPGDAFRNLSTVQIGRNFGEAFAEAIATVPTGEWAGPITSAYGLHLVLIEARTEPGLPPLDVVAPLLRAEFAARQRREAINTFLGALRARYTVTLEEPAPQAAPPN